MKIMPSIFAVIVLLFTTACSTHYSVHGHSHPHHRGNVTVGVHGHSHGRAGAVLGALVVGGVIGHMISEASDDDEPQRRVVVEKEYSDDTESVVNGYEIDSHQTAPLDSRWYQRGKDGKCYLMESVDGTSQVVSLVPDYSCG